MVFGSAGVACVFFFAEREKNPAKIGKFPLYAGGDGDYYAHAVTLYYKL